jgi:hypothetical protein
MTVDMMGEILPSLAAGPSVFPPHHMCVTPADNVSAAYGRQK